LVKKAMTLYRLTLSQEERATLTDWISKGSRKAKDIQKAYVLLASDETTGRESETQLATDYKLSTKSVERIRKSFCEQGMAMFYKKQRKTRSDKKIDGKLEAHLLLWFAVSRLKDSQSGNCNCWQTDWWNYR
jgi:hypothetical protein